MTKLNKVTLNKRLLASGFTFIILCAGLIGFNHANIKGLEPSVANAATVTYTATANLNVRTGPSTANKIIATVKQGTKLTVTGKDANGWLKVSLNGQTGYVSSQYVKISNSSSGSSTATVTYTSTANLNVRTGPSTANKIIATVKQGTKLTVTGKNANGWLKVSLNGQTGYVSSKYVKVSNPTSDAIQVVAKPESIPVLVNKKNKLPENYVPKDLVYTSIPFTFKEKTEKRKMRSEAAAAISKLFAESKKQGVSLLGVSAYRSHATQVALFDYYVKRDGYAKAITYSALPGTSEHETGLAIDVTGGNGKCAAQDCFGGTKEAKWLQAHADDYGFIIRYPKGKESVTGYKYEPWHLRYVGKSIAQTIMSHGITLEEYYYTRAVQN
ncbi:D-alanyl-D-alanine carboxypeptidase [Peribacillus simplex NBRC 15720 = DSM 1321]|uniref:D-alanyl-D-alanine carboxypeptidase n=1 Tax=Peribacillus simplex NBRC 15720 = DSM 1321 TaxID=1349754 RepID=A0A223EPP3_9BACI|nr:D-alanyl-D-alanine carboxypeptidase family protein [Peribacillus simplex]ASS92508.1 D-alanyl-D-alanine carboxypeptidase [Peribacillus simplex NBRC 15720 = DSM 1321]ASS97163.1 D-alanyl-D-alanine carboxypeptidase [Peribacillus simplex NBRC 15720 = DSM 1321]